MDAMNDTPIVVHLASVADHLRPGVTPAPVPDDCGVEPTYRTTTLRDATPVNLFGRSKSRRRVLLVVDQPIFLAGNEADAGSGVGFSLFFTNTPFWFTTTGELWASAPAAFPVRISYMSEFVS